MNIYFVFKMYFKCLENKTYLIVVLSAIMFVTFKVLEEQLEYIW